MGAIRVPPTFLWPQLVGGLLLGAGFIVSGYCPGTGVVAMASGKLDGLATIFGVTAGSVLFGLFYPLYAGFYMSGAMGVATFPALLGVPQPFLALGVAVMAVGAFMGAEKAERAFAARDHAEPPSGVRSTRRRVFALFDVAAAIGLFTLLVPRPAPAVAEKTVRPIDAVEVARRAIEDPTSFWLVDLRAGATEKIPGSLAVPDDDPDARFLADLPPTRDLIVYGGDDPSPLPASVSRFGGDVYVLRGGYDAFAAAILEAPAPPDEPTAEDLGRFRFLSALHAHFTGADAPTEAPVVTPKAIQRAGQKKAGGC